MLSRQWVWVCLGLAIVSCSGSRNFGPSREFLTVTSDRYNVLMQKNGRLDVTLGAGQMVFDDAYSMIWLEGEERPRVLAIDGRGGVRTEVKDALGEGNGLLYTEKDHELLVQTYPIQPFFTVQCSFKNTTDKPVKVKRMMPWCSGGATPGGLILGEADKAVILEDGRTFSDYDDAPRRLVGEKKSLSQWNSAVLNPASGQSVISGFLTNLNCYTQIRIERKDDTPADRFAVYQAECVYDPPLEVKPGDTLRSERLYVAVAESDPLEGLERFGHAMALTNDASRNRQFLPHGWDSWNTKYKTDINEEKMLAALDYVDKNLKRYGWTHFALDDGWQKMRGDWEAHPDRFPHGMKWWADQVHQRGMTAGIWLDAFRVDVESPVAKEHPDWMLQGTGVGKSMIAENERIIDITAPGAYEYVRDVFKKVGNEWGYDALVEADFVYLLMLADGYHDKSLTRIQIFRKGMEAIREGFGKDKFLMSMPPTVITGVYADGLRVGNDCAPIWSKVPDRWAWGATQALTTAARRYYFAPYMWAPDQDCAYFGHPGTRERWGMADQPQLTFDQSVAWFTGAALTGGAVKLGDNFTDLTPEQLSVLKRLLPVSEMPARPIDLFETDNPRIWYLPVKGEVGEWHILGLFNWDTAAPQVVSVPLHKLGLASDAYYTVYNFWGDTYHGTVNDTLEMSVPPGSVQLIGLRKFEDHPMFLASLSHITQGALDTKSLEWHDSDRSLAGSFDAVADSECDLRILVPSPFALNTVNVSVTPEPHIEMVGQLLKVHFHCDDSGRVEWKAQF